MSGPQDKKPATPTPALSSNQREPDVQPEGTPKDDTGITDGSEAFGEDRLAVVNEVAAQIAPEHQTALVQSFIEGDGEVSGSLIKAVAMTTGVEASKIEAAVNAAVDGYRASATATLDDLAGSCGLHLPEGYSVNLDGVVEHVLSLPDGKDIIKKAQIDYLRTRSPAVLYDLLDKAVTVAVRADRAAAAAKAK
ncbi:hypothetical protein SAMN07250955_10657 [Arboricoccus pini]|uniref:Uncharacterized protein n=1 Tax=Arboricoccus pini TaxID=1963835 RepID=A0A212R6M5_9PROT|nr:hypothetical protein [Arboricoccus pini]SNB67807.1 hypothetical protein SAMN07250955_10657 [Arboricoccus pini]